MEVLQFAYEMEKDGEKYYLEQAKKNGQNALSVVFKTLAQDEGRHAERISRLAEDVPIELESANELSDRDSLFQAIKDYRGAVAELPDQAELYHTAMEKERQSIDLYADLSGKAEDDVSRGLFDFLVKEEKRHFTILDELFRHVNRPNEWVESAEFGIREEY
jgi:rubrerythrin